MLFRSGVLGGCMTTGERVWAPRVSAAPADPPHRRSHPGRPPSPPSSPMAAAGLWWETGGDAQVAGRRWPHTAALSSDRRQLEPPPRHALLLQDDAGCCYLSSSTWFGHWEVQNSLLLDMFDVHLLVQAT